MATKAVHICRENSVSYVQTARMENKSLEEGKYQLQNDLHIPYKEIE